MSDNQNQPYTKDRNGHHVFTGDTVILLSDSNDARYSIEQVFKNGKVKIRKIGGGLSGGVGYGEAKNAAPDEIHILRA